MQLSRPVVLVTVLAVLSLGSTGCAGVVTGTPEARPRVTVTVTAEGPDGRAVPNAPTQSPSSATTQPGACSLLTHAEADTLAGRALQPAVGAGQSDQGGFTLCQYTAAPTEPGVAQVSVGVGDGAKKALDIDKETLHHPFQRVQGIGDEAWQEDGHVFLRKGTVWVSIELVLLNDPAENVGRLQHAARIVAGRL